VNGRKSFEEDVEQPYRGRSIMARYGKKAQQTVQEAMHKRKRGKLKSGRSGKTVKSRKQAIAIGLSEARRKGAKVPSRRRKRSSRSRPSRQRS
jgi:hypothetical protein